jgi:hypothetical protein
MAVGGTRAREKKRRRNGNGGSYSGEGWGGEELEGTLVRAAASSAAGGRHDNVTLARCTWARRLAVCRPSLHSKFSLF